MDLTSLQIRVLDHSEGESLRKMVSLFGRVFEMEVEIPDLETASAMLSKNNFFAVVAEYDKAIIGGMSFYLLRRVYNSYPWGYVMDLAVAKEFQRKGIGKMLIEFVQEFGRKLGTDEIYVQTETEDDYALDFYRKTQPSGEIDAKHFFYKLT